MEMNFTDLFSTPCHLIDSLPWKRILFVITLVALPVFAEAQQTNRTDMLIEQALVKGTKLPALDAVRSQLWSRYGTVERFADDLGVPQSELERYLAGHRWDLMHAPASGLTNKKLSGKVFTLASSEVEARVDNFVSQNGESIPAATSAEVKCNKDGITVSFVCKEANTDRLLASIPKKGLLSGEKRWLRDGDIVALKNSQAFRRIGPEATEMTGNPASSVLLDDCVILFLSPVAIGRDHSNLYPAAFVPDLPKWLSETKPAGDKSRVYLEGASYAVAINPNGAVLDLFFDPWDSGTVCPAWSAHSKVSAKVNSDSWEVEVNIPWDALKPRINRDAVWGVDLARLRRAGGKSAVMTRSPESVLLRYDLPIPSMALKTPDPIPEIELTTLVKTSVDNLFPDQEVWGRQARLTNFSELRKGRRNDAIEARISHDEKNLFIRFDCREQDISKLKVVTSEDERTEYGDASRKLSYLDRREQFGLDWGDYVEVILAPNFDFADQYHGGLFTFLVNSRGDLLERFYDSYGMNNVAPHPQWKSGVQTRVTRSGNTWTVELAIPFDDLATMGGISTKWGLNLHRCQSASASGAGEKHFLWSQLPEAIELPGWAPSLRSLREQSRLGILRVDPKTITLGLGKNRPETAVTRPQDIEAKPPSMRDHSSDPFTSVSFVDSDHGWAVGGMGTIQHTDDGGVTWREQDSGTDFILEKVFFLDRQHGWIVGGWPRDPAVALYGGMGVILATRDGGNSWTRQLDGEATWLKDVFFLNKRTGWAVGEFGVILQTTDGGVRWRQVLKTGTRSFLYGITFYDARHGVAVGHDETILSTNDGGESWKPRPSPVPRRANAWPSAYRAVAFADAKHGWIVGDGGSILATEDGGESWVIDNLNLPDAAVDLASFESLHIAPDGTAWAVSPFVVARKRVAAKAWAAAKISQPGMFRAVCFSGESNGWLVGERALVLRSSDRGETWKSQHESPRPMGFFYATAHDHHLNNGPMSFASEEFDGAYACLSRGVRAFELDGDYNRNMVAASAMVTGISTVHSFVEFSWRLRDHPHDIAQRYQNYGGISGVERRLVAMIRALRPPVLIAEQPVLQENYYAHGVGEVARAQIQAFDAAADPEKFPELLTLGLEPYAPEKLYIVTNWATQMFRIHPPTLSVKGSSDIFSDRLGMTYGEAKSKSKNCFWGLLDRARPPKSSDHVGTWDLHLKKWRGEIEFPEKQLFKSLILKK